MSPSRTEGTGTEMYEERISRLEEQVAVLSEAVRALVHGFEDRPDVEPDEHRVAKAARQAHELLLTAKF